MCYCTARMLCGKPLKAVVECSESPCKYCYVLQYMVQATSCLEQRLQPHTVPGHSKNIIKSRLDVEITHTRVHLSADECANTGRCLPLLPLPTKHKRCGGSRQLEPLPSHQQGCAAAAAPPPTALTMVQKNMVTRHKCRKQQSPAHRQTIPPPAAIDAWQLRLTAAFLLRPCAGPAGALSVCLVGTLQRVVAQQLLNQVHVRQHHAPAAVPGQLQSIQRLSASINSSSRGNEGGVV